MKNNQKKAITGISALCIVLAVLMFFAGGCAGPGSSMKYASGFLHDYSKMQPDPGEDGVYIWPGTDKSFQRYTKFIIDPVTLYLAPEFQDAGETLDPAFVDRVTRYFHTAIVDALQDRYPVVDKPGPDVGRLRAAITGVTVERKDLKVYNMIPAALVLTAAGEATGMRSSLMVVFMEAELSDSLTGQRGGAVIQQHTSEAEVKKMASLRQQHLFPVLEFWAKKLRERLDRMHSALQ